MVDDILLRAVNDLSLLRRDAKATIDHAKAPHMELALALLSASPDCVKLFAPDGRLDFMSHAGLCAMEIADLSDIQGKYWWSLWPVTEADQLRNAVDRANAGQHTKFEAFCPTRLGISKWWEVMVAPVLGGDGQVTQILAVSRDITDLTDRTERLQSALAESQILRREVDHRVKNSLGIVSSLLSIQARAVGNVDAAEALRKAAGRVRMIASVHDRLYHTTDLLNLRLDEYMRLLCADIAESIGTAAVIDCDPDLAPVTVPPDTLVAVGLILAELIGNAVRHGNRSGVTGRIRVSLAQPSLTQVALTVADDGPGLPDGFDPAKSRGIGMQVVLSMVQKLAGALELDRAEKGGALFRLSFDPAVVA